MTPCASLTIQPQPLCGGQPANPMLRPWARPNSLRLHVSWYGPGPVRGFHFLETILDFYSWFFWVSSIRGFLLFFFCCIYYYYLLFYFSFLFSFFPFFEHFINFEQFLNLNVFQF
jgi:hypothetical protein